MASTSSSQTVPKICRKCAGPCPPCRPWRCKYGKGRSLAECANDLEKNTEIKIQRTSTNRKQMVIAGTFKNLETEKIFEVNKERVGGGFRSRSKKFRELGGITAPKFRSRVNFEPLDKDVSHIFLAVAADQTLVKFSEEVLKKVVEMSQVQEISSLEDTKCIWPNSVHLKIQAFGKVRNVDIPEIARYCKENIKFIKPFCLKVNGMVHHEKLHTLGFRVEKKTVEALRPFKANILSSSLSKWINKSFRWERYEPVLSLLHTRSSRRKNDSGTPLSKDSINTILQMFENFTHAQDVNPEQHIQLCLAKSSTKNTFYKNLFE